MKQTEEIYANTKLSPILILVPTYNEIENIEKFIRYFYEHLNYDLLIIDDDSPDGTGDAAKKLQSEFTNLHVIIRKSGRGRGSASIRGYQYFFEQQYDILVEMDADFQESVEDVETLIQEAQLGKSDLVVGSRYIDKGGFISRKIALSQVARLGLKLLFRSKIKDLTCGFHLIQRNVFEKVPIGDLISNGFFLFSEIHLRAERKNLKITEVPIFFPDRREGQSKVNLRLVFEFIREALRIRKVL